MRGTAGKILIVLGIILVAAAILWWALAVNALVKIPSGVDTEIDYEGEYTYYVDPVTFVPLPPGTGQTVPMEAILVLLSLDEEYDSGTAVISGYTQSKVAGIEGEKVDFVIVLDRKTALNKADNRAFLLTEDFVVDRSGSYHYQFPLGTSKDRSYMIWKEEIGEPVEFEFVGEQEKGGITVYNFKGNFEGKEVVPDYIEFLGLPTSLSFDQLEDTLAGMGIDLEGLLEMAQDRLSAEDLQALTQIRSQDIPMDYLWSTEHEISVEPRTGVIVDSIMQVEETSLRIDLTALSDLATILSDYQLDPVLGPAIQQLMDQSLGLGKALTLKLVEYYLSQTEESVDKALRDAKKGILAIAVVRTLYSPGPARAGGPDVDYRAVYEQGPGLARGRAGLAARASMIMSMFSFRAQYVYISGGAQYYRKSQRRENYE